MVNGNAVREAVSHERHPSRSRSTRPARRCRRRSASGIEHPSFRLFARRTSGSWGVLNVKLRCEERHRRRQRDGRRLGEAGDTAWHPTPSIALSTVLWMWNGNQSTSVQIVFDPEDYGGAWAIDDVYVDPYSRN